MIKFKIMDKGPHNDVIMEYSNGGRYFIRIGSSRRPKGLAQYWVTSVGKWPNRKKTFWVEAGYGYYNRTDGRELNCIGYYSIDDAKAAIERFKAVTMRNNRNDDEYPKEVEVITWDERS